ncbi:type II toxin-antitoxin system RelE/ParE family toxin [Salinimicrobium xinjiangense]|uniref:type II toxin-antitoxin system RelE/ParE family toxin n=1 Tax=Salinimicrobium xinjiangense TaxID=438596 RepID=UPI000408DE48|nr:type II toxin-antitoxin system RelE/ParE family toxin [Salinimicrobium xinjiangense]
MKIFITKRAEKNYKSITNYLHKEWGANVVEALNKRTRHFFDLLEIFPEMGSIEFPAKNIRGLQLTTQLRVFYTVKEDRIIILSFFDVRQNPEKKNF